MPAVLTFSSRLSPSPQVHEERSSHNCWGWGGGVQRVMSYITPTVPGCRITAHLCRRQERLRAFNPEGSRRFQKTVWIICIWYLRLREKQWNTHTHTHVCATLRQRGCPGSATFINRLWSLFLPTTGRFSRQPAIKWEYKCIGKGLRITCRY